MIVGVSLTDVKNGIFFMYDHNFLTEESDFQNSCFSLFLVLVMMRPQITKQIKKVFKGEIFLWKILHPKHSYN